jgi:uncharacterized protein
MSSDLQSVLDTLRAHEADLRRLGAAHVAVFGSVARGEARTESDIDVLVELDEERPMGIFEYARLKIYINDLLNGASDVVNRRMPKPFAARQHFGRYGACLLTLRRAPQWCSRGGRRPRKTGSRFRVRGAPLLVFAPHRARRLGSRQLSALAQPNRAIRQRWPTKRPPAIPRFGR